MARYIIIDHYSGYVFGDTGDLPPALMSEAGQSPADACRVLDEHNGVAHGCAYDERSVGYRPATNETAYMVYRADVRGSEAVPIVADGQDAETIGAVVRDCELVAVVARTAPPEA